MEKRYRRMEDQKPWHGLYVTRILLKREELKQKLKNENA